MRHLTFLDLNKTQIEQYRNAINAAFPEIILRSQVMKSYWSKLEKYFPFTQIFIIGTDDNLIGFMNTVPVFWDKSLNELPDDGWDWMLRSGITDFEEGKQPNTLGGLQIIVTKEHQGKGFSKILITQAKKVVEKIGYKNFIIPIRPTFKHLHPEMKMSDYINLKKDTKIYDPWIRTHLKSGAKIIRICNNSMNISGDIPFWESLLNQKINTSGKYIATGALNPITIDFQKNHGEYREDNIWIAYA